MAPISLLEKVEPHLDPIFQRSQWSSNPDVDLKVIGHHSPIGKRNSTPMRFGAVMPYKSTTNPIPPPHMLQQQQQQQQQQQLPYPGPIPGPLVGNHFANANPQMIPGGPLPDAVPQHRRLDRSLSEPARNVSVTSINTQQTTQQFQQQQFQQQLQLPPPGQVQPPQTASSRYKTELCRPFAETGFCKYGEKCQFAHGGVDLRSMSRHPKYKTELCRTFHTTGLCGYGTRCHFIHNADERRSPSTPDSGTHSPVSQLSNSPPQNQMNHSSAVIQQRMMYLDKSLKRELNGGISPPASFDGSPTDSAGSFFNEDFSVLPDFLVNDPDMFRPKPEDFREFIYEPTVMPPKGDLPPLIGTDSVSPLANLEEDLSEELENLSISPPLSGSPSYASLRGCAHQQPMGNDRMENLFLDPYDCARYLRLPAFETLTEV